MQQIPSSEASNRSSSHEIPIFYGTRRFTAAISVVRETWPWVLQYSLECRTTEGRSSRPTITRSYPKTDKSIPHTYAI
jgi:hypothetical protein